MNVDDILKSKFSDILKDHDAGEQIFSSPVAFAVTGDLEEVEKLAAIDFTKLKITFHDTPTKPELPMEWVETTRTTDGYAICFDQYSEFAYEPEDVAVLSYYVN